MPARRDSTAPWSLTARKAYLHINLLIHKGALIGLTNTLVSGITNYVGGIKNAEVIALMRKLEYPAKFAAGEILNLSLSFILRLINQYPTYRKK